MYKHRCILHVKLTFPVKVRSRSRYTWRSADAICKEIPAPRLPNQGRRIRGFEGAQAPPEHASAPSHSQKHLLKMKGNVMKHCFKLTSNKFMVVLTLILGLYLGKTDAIYRFTLNSMATSGKAPPRVSTILHPCPQRRHDSDPEIMHAVPHYGSVMRRSLPLQNAAATPAQWVSTVHHKAYSPGTRKM